MPLSWSSVFIPMSPALTPGPPVQGCQPSPWPHILQAETPGREVLLSRGGANPRVLSARYPQPSNLGLVLPSTDVHLTQGEAGLSFNPLKRRQVRSSSLLSLGYREGLCSSNRAGLRAHVNQQLPLQVPKLRSTAIPTEGPGQFPAQPALGPGPAPSPSPAVPMHRLPRKNAPHTPSLTSCVVGPTSHPPHSHPRLTHGSLQGASQLSSDEKREHKSQQRNGGSSRLGLTSLQNLSQ